MKTRHYHRLKLTFISYLLISIILGCAKNASQNPVLEGYYVSHLPSKVSLAYYQLIERKIFTKNNYLTLKPDSTFLMETCGNYIGGKYTTSVNAVTLFCYTNFKKMDSINYKSILPYDTIVYSITNKDILTTTRLVSSRDFINYQSVDRLKKVQQ